MPVISWIGRLARWVAPSAVAACSGAIVAGAVEGYGMGAWGIAATIGLFALIAIPVLLVGGVVVRGLILAWRPRELAARLVEPGGGAPRLAGWIGVIWLGTFAFAWWIYAATNALGRYTTFQPLGVGFAEPIVAVCAALVLVALSRPGARALAAIARRGDARWRRSGRATLLRPRAIVVAAAGSTAIAGAAIWFAIVKPRLGAFDTSVMITPAIAITIAVATHAAWSWGKRYAIAGYAIATLGVAAIAIAFVVPATHPSLALEIWGDRPLAGLAIDQLFDLESIRDKISLGEYRPTDRPGAAHPDIILVTIDTVRADHTPPYGGTAEMPVLRELAARGTVFDWAFSPSNVTRRSIPSMVIGLAPNRVRGRVVGWALRVDPRHVLLAERLRAGGYETAGFMCCYGFWSPEVRTGLQHGLEHLEIEANGRTLARTAAAWLTARESGAAPRRPLFLWMHILEPHNWTLGVGTPRNDDERKRFYDRALAASDAMLGDLLRPLGHRAPAAAPIVIVTADHGEALGEHGHDYHSTDLYNSQMHVPLVVVGPGVRTQTVPETVSLTDLVPTIVELAGFRPPSGLDGRSLADVATGVRGSVSGTGTAFAAMIKDRSNPGGVAAFVKGGWKIIDVEGSPIELYDIYKDPDERFNVANERREILRELQDLLDARRAAGDISPFE